MKLKSILDSLFGFRYMFEDLDLSSSLSRTILMESHLLIDKNEIESVIAEMKMALSAIDRLSSQELTDLRFFKHKLCDLRDIRGTLSRLSSGEVMDDTDLFEIKNLILINSDLSQLIKRLHLSWFVLPDLSQELTLLDPDDNRISSFYVYDSYSETLVDLRNRYRRASEDNRGELFDLILSEEYNIRVDITKRLRQSCGAIEKALFSIANFDILFSKVFQIERLGLSIPKIGVGDTYYNRMFNPELKALLERDGKHYTQNNIKVDNACPVLITGANMGGKSVVLKTLALNQYLFQFGFGVAAEEAVVTPVKEIFFSIGDNQDYNRGLSSFSAEMLYISSVLHSIEASPDALVLIDEPARTTNPLEGTALAESLISLLKRDRLKVVVTSHYNISTEGCKRLRVMGLVDNKMDYNLIEDSSGIVPLEAINIAKNLKIYPAWIDLAEKKLLAEKN